MRRNICSATAALHLVDRPSRVVTKRKAARPLAPETRFVARLREALSRFSDGVHTLDAPATAAEVAAAERRLGVSLHATVKELYAFADGLWLFDEVVRVHRLAELTMSPRQRVVCAKSDGVSLTCDVDGRIYEEDEDGDTILSGLSLEDELLVRLARESLLIDAEGEWKDVFGLDGELLPAVRRRRNEAARKRAPHAARWLIEAAELSLELDEDQAAAESLLAEAVAKDPGAAPAHELLGLLLIAHGEVVQAADALALAATGSGVARRADRASIAAEAAERAGKIEARVRLAAMARAAEPGIVARLAREAETALDSNRVQDADRLTAILGAIADVSDELPTRLRIRKRLKTLA